MPTRAGVETLCEQLIERRERFSGFDETFIGGPFEKRDDTAIGLR